MKVISPLGTSWNEYKESLLSPEERAVIKMKVDLISEIVRARQSKNLSQQKLGEISRIKQPIIARLEKGRTNPQLETLIKLLLPLGLTITVTPIDQ
ncbi:MAG: helix-turn-helix domain-containing protein [Candidatus Ozemobacteraceae bacterium]|jgi:ribosome-binding protein aMBF1 (putative translation factor)|nr:helix-turn-helix domain-containing protein [Candidatus Riflebacteria bacterium]NLV93085.1 helix-turn-helix domain-containing protein [Candidatus Riflebacteria bacterium]